MATYNLGQEVEMVETFRVSGVPTDPTAVTFYLRDPLGAITSYVFGIAGEVTHPSSGRYVLTILPLLDGSYQYWVVGTGAVEATSSPGTFNVLAEPGSVPTTITTGPCSPWIDGQDVANCCTAASEAVGSDFSSLEEIAREASSLLFDMSGRLYAGLCEKTVRPCATAWCGFQILSRGHIVGPWDIWGAWGWTGSFWNWPNGRSCGCNPISRVKLAGYPVRSITEVKIDGAVINPNEYRLDENRWLTRMADSDGNTQWFPTCQRMDLPDTAMGTWSVTYRYGLDPPLAAVHAAEQLACQIYLACAGQECLLPTGTTRITRQGITIDRQFLRRDSRTGAWATGMNLVDSFLNATNASGLTRRPVITSPDAPRYPRSVGN